MYEYSLQRQNNEKVTIPYLSLNAGIYAF